MYKTEYYTQYPALLTFWRRHLGNKRYTYEVLEKKKDWWRYSIQGSI